MRQGRSGNEAGEVLGMKLVETWERGKLEVGNEVKGNYSSSHFCVV